MSACSPDTLKLRRSQMRVYRAWLDSRGLTPATVTRADLVTWLAGMPEPETRASYRAAVRGLHAWWLAAGLADHDPTATLPPVRRPAGVPRPIPGPVLADALDRATPQQRDMLVLGRLAGLRVSEIVACHGDDLGGRPGAEVLRIVGKGHKVRTVPAHPDVVRILRAHPGQWVFPSPVHPGRHLSRHTAGVGLSELLGDGWSAHSLRHAFATDAYAATRDLLLVGRWLGHVSPVTTARYVALADPECEPVRSLHLVA